MGIETAAIIVAAIGAAATVYGTTQSQRASKKAANSQKEASDIAAAQQKQQMMDERRNQIRQQRIRTAQIEQGASNVGASMSSGELGSLSALSTNVSNNLARLSGSNLAAQGIASANQSTLNAQQDIQTAGAISSLGGSALSLAAPAAGKGLSKLFSSSTGTQGS